MLDSYLIGVGATVALCVLWVMVQAAWRATFADVRLAADALAGRSSCGDAGCGSDCALHAHEEHR